MLFSFNLCQLLAITVPIEKTASTIVMPPNPTSVEISIESIENEIIDSEYICYTLDWWPDQKCDWGNCSWVGTSVNHLNFDDSLLINAAAGLDGLLRVGGTLSDQVIYELDTEIDDCKPRFAPKNTSDKHHAWTDGCVTRQRIDKLIEFVENAKIKMVFSIAALWGGRKNETNWKSENAEQLIHHIVESNKADLFYGF